MTSIPLSTTTSRADRQIEIGFVFQKDGNFAGVDLDDCRTPSTDEVDDWAQEIIHELGSYTERSPSGTGFHIIVAGDVPSGVI